MGTHTHTALRHCLARAMQATNIDHGEEDGSGGGGDTKNTHIPRWALPPVWVCCVRSNCFRRRRRWKRTCRFFPAAAYVVARTGPLHWTKTLCVQGRAALSWSRVRDAKITPNSPNISSSRIFPEIHSHRLGFAFFFGTSLLDRRGPLFLLFLFRNWQQQQRCVQGCAISGWQVWTSFVLQDAFGLVCSCEWIMGWNIIEKG